MLLIKVTFYIFLSAPVIKVGFKVKNSPSDYHKMINTHMWVLVYTKFQGFTLYYSLGPSHLQLIWGLEVIVLVLAFLILLALLCSKCIDHRRAEDNPCFFRYPRFNLCETWQDVWPHSMFSNIALLTFPLCFPYRCFCFIVAATPHSFKLKHRLWKRQRHRHNTYV